MSLLLPFSLLWPLLLAAALGHRKWQTRTLPLIPTASLPALLLVPFVDLDIHFPWLLLGTRLGVDEAGVLFLLLAGLLWAAAGFYARGYMANDRHRRRFQLFYLLTYTGNLGVILALDVASFYLFFTLLTFAAYGLIIHDGSIEARRAGRIYLILGVIGEVLLLAATLIIGATLGNVDLRELAPLLAEHPQRTWLMGLILIGFGIKMGAVPLHIWLPLAHPCAPTPASAVLSGIIIKAGLLGWLRFLPLGTLSFPAWGELCLTVGMLSAFYGVLMGLPQKRPKTVLAYSSISQMGLITALLGIAFYAPQNWPLLLTTLLLFSLHHGLAKGALFLGVGVTAKGIRWAGWALMLPALALAGAPLTSGFLAKLLLKDTVYLAPASWSPWLPILFTLSSIATTLLMVRFLYLAWPRGQTEGLSVWLTIPWIGLLILSLSLPWLWAGDHFPEVIASAFTLKSLTGALWPLLIAIVLAVAIWGIGRLVSFRPHLPEGDIVVFFTGLKRLWPRPSENGVVAEKAPIFKVTEKFTSPSAEPEPAAWSWQVIGVVFLALGLGLMILFSVFAHF